LSYPYFGNSLVRFGLSLYNRSVRNDSYSLTADARPESDDQLHEQGYLDGAYRHLEAMTRRASSAAADAAERSAGDWDATVAHHHLTRRVKSLAGDARPLCFGRIEEESGPRWYIGRRHVEDDRGEAVVVDWRAPVSVPFYRATFRDPLGLRLRRRFILEEGRRIIDLLDEDFDDPDTAGRIAASGLPDPMLAELGRSRTGTMHDIVATIAAEQDRIIRAPLDTPVIVQGGPGTGKTAVGLHRAAFLLFEHRQALEREGVLVLGPNRLFLAYISEVLPSLGEAAVVQTTIAGLAGAWRVAGVDALEVACLKGEARMAAVVARACRGALRSPEQSLQVSTRWASVRLAAAEIGEVMEAALASGGPIAQQRTRFRRAIAQRVAAMVGQRRPELVLDAQDIAADLRRDRIAEATLNRLWPNQSPAGVLRALLGRPALLAQAAQGILDRHEMEALRRRPGSSVALERWTDADLALLDEAQSQLSGPPRRYGHVVVDEAQDLSAMALRMVARRSRDGRSLTILGDLAQATAPGATRDWTEAIEALGNPSGARIEPLSIGYRVPRQIMDLANRLLASMAPGLAATTSVRVSEHGPIFRRVQEPELATAVVEETADVLSRFGSVAIIAVSSRIGELLAGLRSRPVPVTVPGQPPTVGEVSLLEPAQAKGLEFDAVVVVDPAAFLREPAGAGLLYIALSRAVQHLSVVHVDALPAPLAA
jgi:DNA helicase IV